MLGIFDDGFSIKGSSFNMYCFCIGILTMLVRIDLLVLYNLSCTESNKSTLRKVFIVPRLDPGFNEQARIWRCIFGALRNLEVSRFKDFVGGISIGEWIFILENVRVSLLNPFDRFCVDFKNIRLILNIRDHMIRYEDIERRNYTIADIPLYWTFITWL